RPSSTALLPSCPCSSAPHASTVPLASSARLNSPPAEIATTPLRCFTATGTLLELVFRVPSWPCSLLPHAITAPFARGARVRPDPAEDAHTLVTPATATGTSEFSLPLPIPSCPLSLLPHAIAVPFASSARLWAPPAATAVTLERPSTSIGT